jgi:hypothetical protein
MTLTPTHKRYLTLLALPLAALLGLKLYTDALVRQAEEDLSASR